MLIAMATTTTTNPKAALSKYRIHPVADLFPMIGDAEIADLADDIAANGLQEPVWMYQGELLDGRNRVVACAMAGVEPLRQEWVPQGDQTPLAFVMSRNLFRRHLTASQRAALAVELQEVWSSNPALSPIEATFSHSAPAPATPAPTPSGTRVEFKSGERSTSAGLAAMGHPITSPAPPGKARDRAAQALNVSAGYVNDAAGLKRTDPAMFESVRAGERTIQAAQDEIVAKARQEGTTESLTLRPAVIRDATARLEEKESKGKPKPPPIRLPKFSKVQSSATTIQFVATFGNSKIAEDILNRLQDDPKCLDLDYEVLDKRPARKKSAK